MKKQIDGLLDDLLSTHRGDPHNAPYLVPLPNAEDEEMAHRMADSIYCARADNFADHITKEQADRVYEQCLVDSRRMICDEDYARIFRE